MSSTDDFVHIYAGRSNGPTSSGQSVSNDFFKNSEGLRQYTEGLIVESIKTHHPNHHLTVSPGFASDLLAFANSRDDISYTPHGKENPFLERIYLPPARRYNDDNGGTFLERVMFGCYDYVFKGTTFLIYIVEGHDGPYHSRYNYVLVEDQKTEGPRICQKRTDELLESAARWSEESHEEVLVFDNGFWQKSKDLWQNIQKANWEDVILEEEKKSSLIKDVIGFFDAENRYSEFGVPWKRGIIFYGPPGNGKTISTKALMHDVSKRTSPGIESLYVKSFSSFQGPEYGIRQIFLKARQMAPCLLIFEDIDSLVSPNVRSYFLNEVDGLESNHGILMIGSTNHLERLDPGISKRPSRFDRKYFFDVPNREERIQYCEYWRSKLRKNEKVEFPKQMSAKVADITRDFSFAYMKEAFVAALLVIVARTNKQILRYQEDDLSGNILWQELKKQIESLRKEMENESVDASPSMSGMWPALNSILDETASRPVDINNAMPRHY